MTPNPDKQRKGTSIGFGGGEVVEVEMPLDKVRVMVQGALAGPTLLEFIQPSGEVVVVNPIQIKVLQRLP